MNPPRSIFVTLCLALAATWHSAVQCAATDVYVPTRISDKVRVIYGPLDLPNAENHGFRNNVVLVITSAGTAVCDPGGSAWAGEMVARAVAGEVGEIVAVFDSHAHGEHWLGNEGIKRHYPNAVIYGHPIMKARIEGSDGVNWLETINRVTEGTADGRVVVPPDHSVEDGEIITIGDTRFRVRYVGRAHTDNDIMIEVIGEGLLFTGDVVRNGLLGIMEEDSSFAGNITAIEQIIGDDYRYYIPGHGRAGGKEMLERYAAYLRTLRQTVAELYDEGLADYEMKPAAKEAVHDYADWAGFEMRVGPHVSRAYLEIEAEAFQ
jgi:glyoxylase-like metal-dependent hydrolase (beta-lactamase superfamily II)